ncbi:MAG: mechanosensitive ion channel family protein [Acaryochloridaceae cyanobacterium RL_2_7]|nr:mechanosensitive ion channel family protein [Acaryochloridaceae cyanobacterium RL_2_7]
MSLNSRPLTIATVTPADSDFYSETSEQIAQQWKETLQKEIDEAEKIYSPQVFQQRLWEVIVILLGLVLLTGLISFLRWRLVKKQKALQTQQTTEKEAAAVEQSLSEQDKLSSLMEGQPQRDQAKEAESTQALNFFQRQLNLDNQLNIYGFVRWLMLWVIILGWYAGVYFLTTRLPILMQWSNWVLTQPINLMITWFVISFAMRSSRFLIQRSIHAWNDSSYLDFGDAQRKVLRSQTIVGALQGLATCVLLVFGLLLTLIQFGLPASSILAGSAVIGLALSFGAQNLVKDVVNGCLILLEDQYAVGDIITANGETGLVEKLNLRLTQLRSLDGELISIPNSSIALVKNKTSSWSRVNMGIDVAYNTDLDHAIAVIDTVATQMSQDPKWRSLILDPPQVLGVDAFGDNSITIRLWIRTEPLQQWPVGREFRRRLKKAFDLEGISIPFPQRSIWFENSLATTGPAQHNQPSTN